MFTGLVETTATVRAVRTLREALAIDVAPDAGGYVVSVGDSVAVDGVCLTVESFSESVIRFTAVSETLSRSTLSKARQGDVVNLERAVRLGDRMGGHLVSGHVDGTGTIVDDRRRGEGLVRSIRIPAELVMFMAEKGSVSLDGVSLTIAESSGDRIAVWLVPHTMARTNVLRKKAGDPVNIECDLMARYIFQLLKTGNFRSVKAEDTGGGGSGLLKKLEAFGF